MTKMRIWLAGMLAAAISDASSGIPLGFLASPWLGLIRSISLSAKVTAFSSAASRGVALNRQITGKRRRVAKDLDKK